MLNHDDLDIEEMRFILNHNNEAKKFYYSALIIATTEGPDCALDRYHLDHSDIGNWIL